MLCFQPRLHAAEQGARLQPPPAFVFGGQNGHANTPPMSPGPTGVWPGPAVGPPPHPASYGQYVPGSQPALPLQLPMVRSIRSSVLHGYLSFVLLPLHWHRAVSYAE